MHIFTIVLILFTSQCYCQKHAVMDNKNNDEHEHLISEKVEDEKFAMDEIEESEGRKHTEVVSEIMVFSFITTIMLVFLTPLTTIMLSMISTSMSFIFYYGTFMLTYQVIYQFYQEIAATQKKPSVMSAIKNYKDSIVAQVGQEQVDLKYWISEESLEHLTEFVTIAINKFLDE